MPVDDLQPIRHAAEGLEYPSESDAPFEVFRWPASMGTDVRQAVAANVPKGAAIAEVVVADFFKQLDETSDAEGFRKLHDALAATLGDLHVFRAGEVRVAIFVIGRCKGGDWAGVRTESVET